MLKDFWDNHKYIIEIVAIFIALGALFMAIPLPSDNPSARFALLNIQSAWLLIITVATIILFIYFIIAISLAEEKYSKQNNLDAGGTASLIVGVLLIWIIYWLWKYMIAQYHEPLKNLLPIILQGAVLIDTVLLVFIGRKLAFKFNFYNRNKFYLLSMVFILLNGLVLGCFAAFMNLDFKLRTFLIYTVIFSFLAGFSEILCIIKLLKQKKLNV